jgi:hypothetical protein
MTKNPRTMARNKAKTPLASRALFPTIHHAKKRALLTAYAAMGRLVQACQAVHMGHSLHYYWQRTDPDYAAAFDEAKRLAGERLEEEAIRRALGYEETHHTSAGTPYQVTKYSDTLLIFLLKGMMPQKYGDTVAHTGTRGAPAVLTVLYEDARGTPA